MAACEQEPLSMTETDKRLIRENVKQTLNNYYADVKKYGLEAEFNYLDSSSNFFWVPPGYTSPISYAQVATILKQNARNYKMVDNSFDTLQIVPLTSRLATYTGRLRSTVTDTLGKTITYMLVESGTVIKRKKTWKNLSGQTTLHSE
jgi:hypothetical protein